MVEGGARAMRGAKVRVELGEERRGAARCAYCLEGDEAESLPCPACATALHVECWREVRACPTVGCAVLPEQVIAKRPERVSEQRRRAGPAEECRHCGELSRDLDPLVTCTVCGARVHRRCGAFGQHCPFCNGSLGDWRRSRTAARDQHDSAADDQANNAFVICATALALWISWLVIDRGFEVAENLVQVVCIYLACLFSRAGVYGTRWELGFSATLGLTGFFLLLNGSIIGAPGELGVPVWRVFAACLLCTSPFVGPWLLYRLVYGFK